MRIKKFTAGTMREALMQIKNELGEDAIILKTRKLPKKVFALGSHEEVEVTAAVDEQAAPAAAPPAITMNATNVYARPRPPSAMPSNIIDPDDPDAPEIKSWEPPRAVDERFKERSLKLPRREDDRREKQELSELKDNVKELREMVKGILEKGATPAAGGFSGGWGVLYKKLITAEVRHEFAESLIRNSANGDHDASEHHAEKKLAASFTSQFPVAGPLKLKKGRPLVVTFIGPTGSGKTTTLAKLAAHCCINKKKQVSIIAADTYRIAAIEQIRMFADIIKVKVQVVFSPEEIPSILESCSSDDIVLVDTAGRSQRNLEHMADLKELLAALGSDEVHLVMSAATKDADLADCIERYKPYGVNRLLFTKLDETTRIGNIYNTVHQSRIPVSYFTTGQSVPDDIEVAQVSRFMERMFEGCAL